MKKILIMLLLLFIITFLLAGCDTYEEAREGAFIGNDYGEGYFTVIKSWGGVGVNCYMIVYANDTKVMYFVDMYTKAGGITPLYNPDGTLQIYSGC